MKVAHKHHTQPVGGGEGGTPKWQCAHLVHGMQAREVGYTSNQEDEEGAPPEQSALPEHGMH